MPRTPAQELAHRLMDGQELTPHGLDTIKRVLGRSEFGMFTFARDAGLLVKVSDGAPDKVPVLYDEPRGEHGYGLRIVDQLSERWGYDTDTDTDRKRVWASLDLNVASTW